MLRIADVGDTAAARRRLDALAGADPVIFISANAVRRALTLRPGLLRSLQGARLATLGAASERALRDAGWCGEVLRAPASTSEALLDLPCFSVASLRRRRVAIVRGEEGRTLLARSLRERGAEVQEVETYRRLGPEGDFKAFLDRHAATIQVAIVTSSEALQNLLAHATGAYRDRLLDWALVLPSERVASHARMLGFRARISVPAAMSDAAMAAAVAGLLDADARD
jgi:uroporphyrinogen-III synthase